MGRKYTPFNENIIVRRNATEEKSEGGIFIPEEHQDKPQEGEVLAVGRGYLARDTGVLTPLQVQVGDHVLFGRYAGNDVKMGGEMVAILKEDELLASYIYEGDDEPITPKRVIETYEGDVRQGVLTQLAKNYRKEGYSMPAATAAIRQTNAEQCKPPLEDGELEAITIRVFDEE